MYNTGEYFLNVSDKISNECGAANIIGKFLKYIIKIHNIQFSSIILLCNKQVIFESIYSENKNLNGRVFEKKINRFIKFNYSNFKKPSLIQNNPEYKNFDLCTKNFNSKYTLFCTSILRNNDQLGVLCIGELTNKKLDHEKMINLAKHSAEFIFPFTKYVFQDCLQKYSEKFLENEVRKNFKFKEILGSHPKIVNVLKLVSQVAKSDATILIQGESGTGKELIAKALHSNSARVNNPFIPINCSAIPESLLESELFGHVRGAFTGAVRENEGWFEKANGGTIFLDEVGKMSDALQIKLLRVLQTGEYSRVGSSEICFCDVRIIAATESELKKLVEENKFREDVFYRLNVIDINLPTLRERKTDILLLADFFISKYSEKYNKKCFYISDEARTLLLSYDYPGNIRELENAIERAMILTEKFYIDTNDLPASMYYNRKNTINIRGLSSYKIQKQMIVEDFERAYISNCLKLSKGNISRAAKSAEMDIKNFYIKMKKCRIDPQFFKNRH